MSVHDIIGHLMTLIRKGEVDQATAYLEKVKSLVPDGPQLARAHAELAWKAGRLDEADEIYTKSLERFPESSGLFAGQINLLAQQGKYSRIVEVVNWLLQQDSRKSAWVLGNCQAPEIAAILTRHPGFVSRFKLVALPPVHLMEPEFQEILLKELVPQIGLMVTQNLVNENFHLRTSEVRKYNDNVLVIPTCFFRGYQPDSVYLKNRSNPLCNEPLSEYHSSFVFYGFLNKMTPEACTKSLMEGDWIAPAYLDQVDKMFDSLRVREQYWDVRIVDFIYDNFRNAHLFNTFNHPTGLVVHKIVDGILENINLSPMSTELRLNSLDILNDNRLMVSKRVGEYLRLSPHLIRLDFRFGAKRISPEEFVKLHYDFYESQPALVEENREGMLSHIGCFM